MNVLFDTNIVLDALLDREPFGRQAIQLFNAIEEGRIQGFLCANSVTTVFYLMQKGAGRQKACRLIRLLLELFDITPVTRGVIEDALDLPFEDFEDGVIYQAAVNVNADGIVTRNRKDFTHAKIAIYSPVEVLAILDRK